MKSSFSTQPIVWKNSPIKADMGIVHKVQIQEKQEEKKPNILRKLGYKSDMTKEEFAKFLEAATTLFDDDETPMKVKQPKDPKIAQQTQSQYDLLFASPNESFQAVPYHYEEEEEAAAGSVNIMDESMEKDPVGDLSVHLTEEEADYMSIIKRITNSNKTNNGIPHPHAPVDVSNQEDFDDCRVMTQPSLHQYSFHNSDGEINVASSIDSNTSYVREIRSKSNPLASSRDVDANSISFGIASNDLMLTIAQVANPGDSVESLDIQAIIAKNRATINRSKGLVVSEAQKYLDNHAPGGDHLPTWSGNRARTTAASSSGSTAVSDTSTRQTQLADSHSELMAAMDDGLSQHWATLQDMQKEIEKFRQKGAPIAHHEENLQLQLDHLLMMSPEALQTIVFSQHDKLVQVGIFTGEDI